MLFYYINEFDTTSALVKINQHKALYDFFLFESREISVMLISLHVIFAYNTSILFDELGFF